MCNPTVVAKAFVIGARTLALCVIAIAVGVNSTWAGSNQPSGLKFTPILSEGAAPHSTYRLVQACAGFHQMCDPNRPDYACCQGLVCVPNPNANARMWCEQRRQ
jgi:hypothetical protein